jgi:hypothetical protein
MGGVLCTAVWLARGAALLLRQTGDPAAAILSRIHDDFYARHKATVLDVLPMRYTKDVTFLGFI